MTLRYRYKVVSVGYPVVTLKGRPERPRPVIGVTVIGPANGRYREALVDSAADDTVFPEWVAAQIGIDLTNAPKGMGTGAGKTHVPLRYAEVTLRITDGQEFREWRAWVGFTSAPMNRSLLGFAGCLQFFLAQFYGDREELEMTVNSLYPGT